MSIHSSLRGGDTLQGERSVLTRQERIAALKKVGKFEEDKRSVYGLPKVRTKFKVAGAKKKVAKEAAPGVSGAPGAVAPGAAAPAAAAGKGAAGKTAAPAAGAKGAAAPAGAKPAAAPAAAKKGEKK
jgi:small basic protein (TIGR04137 family)